jgi:dihydrofolate synthase / folylpolyglutamate synthase
VRADYDGFRRDAGNDGRDARATNDRLLRVILTYPDSIKFLYDLHWFGARPGLETTRKLAQLAGNPQERLRFIHVAGTNGKGSTCAMLESLYRAAGLRTGLFTSPHLVSFRERIQVNREWISEADLVRLTGQMRGFLPALAADQHPTLFEVATVMALCYFAEQKCDLVIWETGLGGRLDATNIVTPLASVITNVQHDHEQWLGHTLPGIAREKAGIIKPGVPVLTAAAEPEVLEVIAEMARQNRAPLTVVETDLSATSSVPLPGDHQVVNAALAKATVEVLRGKIAVSESVIRTGLETVQWSGRLQTVETAEGRTLLLDCAHNLAGATALVTAIRQLFPSAKPALILGILNDKDWRHICGVLAPVAGQIVTVPVGSERTASPEELAAACRSANPQAEVESTGSLNEAFSRTGNRELTVIAGSMYLIGEAMELLGLGPKNAGSERALNEWGGRPSAAAVEPPTR